MYWHLPSLFTWPQPLSKSAWCLKDRCSTLTRSRLQLPPSTIGNSSVPNIHRSTYCTKPCQYLYNSAHSSTYHSGRCHLRSQPSFQPRPLFVVQQLLHHHHHIIMICFYIPQPMSSYFPSLGRYQYCLPSILNKFVISNIMPITVIYSSFLQV